MNRSARTLFPPTLSQWPNTCQRRRQYSSARTCEPLRILFCGSDDFSSVSLRALHVEHVQRPHEIESIQVLCRPGKRTGRGLKVIRDAPIKNVAESLKLPVHERGSFEGWEGSWDHALHPVNLIIAVSFGLLIPREVLRSAAYGGLNLHPSLLPEFRGAAPLHHILLSGRRHIGVSLQTLHPTRFDHGTVLAQTPYPGDEIPSPDTCTVQELKDFVAPKGAAMLVRGICEKLFLPPVQDVSWWKGDRSSDGAKSFPRAPKVTPQDSQVAWSTWTAAEILRRQRVLGPLWTQVKERDGETGTRVIMHGLQEAPRLRAPTWKTGHFYLAKADTLPRLLLRTCDERVLSVDQITVEGRPRMDAVAAAHRYRELLAHESEHGSLEETGRD